MEKTTGIHMRNYEEGCETSAACRQLDYGDILSIMKFEERLDKKPGDCCPACAKIYEDLFDQRIYLIKDRNEDAKG